MGEEKCSKRKKAFGILKEVGLKLRPSNGHAEDFRYEYMNSLMVNGRDIYIQMNDFLTRFFAHTKSEKVGLALADLFEALIDEPPVEQKKEDSLDAIDSTDDGEHIHA